MTKYVVRTEADEQLFRPLPDEQPEAGYLLFQNEDDDHWTWIYIEPGEDDEFGPSLPTRAEALENIAANWLNYCRTDRGCAGDGYGLESGGPMPKFVGAVRALEAATKDKDSWHEADAATRSTVESDSLAGVRVPPDSQQTLPATAAELMAAGRDAVAYLDPPDSLAEEGVLRTVRALVVALGEAEAKVAAVAGLMDPEATLAALGTDSGDETPVDAEYVARVAEYSADRTAKIRAVLGIDGSFSVGGTE